MKFDLKDVETFVLVANMRSFSKAAKLQNLSANQISVRIKNLEKSLNMNLFARTTREVNLTSDGKNLFSYFKSVIEKVEDVNNFIDRTKEISGVMRIVIPPYFSRYHIAPYLEEFLQEYPKLKIEITSTENPINIIAGGYDLQIRIQTPGEEEGLEIAKLATNHKILCASRAYIKKHGKPTKPDDLLKHNCIVFGENSTWKFKHKKTGAISELKKIAGNVKCDNGEIIKELVLAGIGITVKSSRDIEEEITSGKLVVLLEDYKVLHETEFYVVYPAGKYKSEKVMCFVDFFRKKMQSLKS